MLSLYSCLDFSLPLLVSENPEVVLDPLTQASDELQVLEVSF